MSANRVHANHEVRSPRQTKTDSVYRCYSLRALPLHFGSVIRSDCLVTASMSLADWSSWAFRGDLGSDNTLDMSDYAYGGGQLRVHLGVYQPKCYPAWCENGADQGHSYDPTPFLHAFVKASVDELTAKVKTSSYSNWNASPSITSRGMSIMDKFSVMIPNSIPASTFSEL